MAKELLRAVYIGVTSAGPILALLLQALVLSRFLDSRNRNYPLAILFTLTLFLTTVFACILRWYIEILPSGSDFVKGYEAADLCMHILLLALMLQLIRETLLSLGESTQVTALLAGVSALVAITAYLFFDRDFSKTRQVVSFWMVLLNLYWWSLLLRKRKVQRRVMLLSAGIGLMMTGQVIGDGLVILGGEKKTEYLIAAYLAIFLTHYACLYTWFRAFSGPTGENQGLPSPNSL